MVLESAQILSTSLALVYNCAEQLPGLYKPTHLAHPSTLWACCNPRARTWLFKHYVALCEEFKARRGVEHASAQLKPILASYVDTEGPDRPGFIFVGPGHIREQRLDIFSSYKLYLEYKWALDKRVPTWYGKEITDVVV